MKLKIKQKHWYKIKLIEKDEELKGYNILLRHPYFFIDGTQYEYVETSREANDFLEMVKEESLEE